MPIPPTAQAFSQAMGPTEKLDWVIILDQADNRILQPGEGVADWTLSLAPEAIAVGLAIIEDAAHGPNLDGVTLKFWLEVTDDMQTSAIFDGGGASLPGELTIVTTSIPPRTRKRTFVVKVAKP
jgi:hypothetical protein